MKVAASRFGKKQVIFEVQKGAQNGRVSLVCQNRRRAWVKFDGVGAWQLAVTSELIECDERRSADVDRRPNVGQKTLTTPPSGPAAPAFASVR